MKKIIYLGVLLFLGACQNQVEPVVLEVEQNSVDTLKKTEVAAATEIKEYSNLLGNYVGVFEAENLKKGGSLVNKINISIDKIAGDSIWGHSVVAGNNRPFEGRIDLKTMAAKVAEPGNDRYDGVFEFVILSDSALLRGIWIANDTKLKVNRRFFDLQRKEFAYNKDLNLTENVEWQFLYDKNNPYGEADEGEILTSDVVRFNASNTLLKKEDVENMYKGDLEVIRNAIYARHGYSFKNRKMRYIFDFVEWYIPISADIRSGLTALEKKNIDLLKRYEGHAEMYYDAIGR